MTTNIHNFQERIEGFIKYDKPIQFVGRQQSFEAIGQFPYETARIRGNKIPSLVVSDIKNMLTRNRIFDNKIVVVFRVHNKFNTHDFAIFFHDDGVIIGAIKDIQKY